MLNDTLALLSRGAPRAVLRVTLAACVCLPFAGCGEGGGEVGGGSLLAGSGGSTARMALVGDYLYAIAGSDVQLFDLTEPATPQPWTRVSLDRGIETLFPFGDYLLVGSSDGVFILDNADPAAPREVGEFVHAAARDPVVAQGGYAYVTLRTDDTRPPPFTENRLDVLDIADLTAPALAGTVAMQSPAGLAIRGDRLYVCDGRAGLKTFDVANPVDPMVIDSVAGEDCHDMILSGDLLHVVAPDGLRQYDLTLGVPRLLSELPSTPVVYVADR